MGFPNVVLGGRTLEPHREQLALHCLGLAGYETNFSRLREHRITLFPGYCFLTVEAQWYAAPWSLGIIGLIMDGIKPARVADHIIDDLRKRERNGLIELPKRPGLKPGDRVRVLHGPLAGQLRLYAGHRPQERVLVLLALLGGQQRVELARDGIEAVGQAVLERMLRSVLDALLPEPLER